mgnify:CR=1 FL=1
MPAPPNVGLWPSAGERPVGYRGSLEYCGRTCYDIVGTVRDSYAAQIGAGQFRMYVDQETGILLMLDAWNDQAAPAP